MSFSLTGKKNQKSNQKNQEQKIFLSANLLKLVVMLNGQLPRGSLKNPIKNWLKSENGRTRAERPGLIYQVLIDKEFIKNS